MMQEAQVPIVPDATKAARVVIENIKSDFSAAFDEDFETALERAISRAIELSAAPELCETCNGKMPLVWEE